jgi:hypothetical protein
MVATASQDIRIASGDSELHRLEVRGADGSPADLASASARYVARSRETAATVIVKALAIARNYPTRGDELLTSFDPTDTADLAGQKLDHEWEIVDIAGNVSTVATGRLVVSGDIA